MKIFILPLLSVGGLQIMDLSTPPFYSPCPTPFSSPPPTTIKHKRVTPRTRNGSPAKKMILLLGRSIKLQFSRKRTQMTYNEPSNNIELISTL